MSLLRVLDLENVSSGVTNDDVKEMVKRLPLLKYLSLRRCRGITHLPDSLEDLKHLQTLDVRVTSVTMVPKSIIKLEQLEYIRAGTSLTSPPPAESPLLSDNSDVERSLPTAEAKSPSLSAKGRSGDTPQARNWLPKLRSTQCRHEDDPHNGVEVPRGIGKLSNLHTLGVVNISPAGKEEILDELKKLTQLHKLGVSGINQNNSQKLFRAISDLAHLESLSLQLQLDEGNYNVARCLDSMSKKTEENLRSLKLYGLKRNLPVWTKVFRNLRKLSLQMTVLTEEGINAITNLKTLKKVSLFLSEFQDNKLQLDSLELEILEISCDSRLQATIKFQGKQVKVLRFHCWGLASLRISGLKHIECLKEVWLRGPCNEAHKKHFKSEVGNYPVEGSQNKPVLRLEEPGSWTPWLLTSS